MRLRPFGPRDRGFRKAGCGGNPEPGVLTRPGDPAPQHKIHGQLGAGAEAFAWGPYLIRCSTGAPVPALATPWGRGCRTRRRLRRSGIGRQSPTACRSPFTSAFQTARRGNHPSADLPRAVKTSHERMCPVSRPVETGTPLVSAVAEPQATTAVMALRRAPPGGSAAAASWVARRSSEQPASGPSPGPALGPAGGRW